jgi:hypothetical protein
MSASSLSFKTAVALAIVGILMGIAMAAAHDHAVMPAHAHLNLLGWVSLFLFGIYYKLHPTLDASKFALTQVGVWIAGTVVLTIGVAALHLGNPGAEPIAIIGSLLVLVGIVLFAVLVFRPAISSAKVRLEQAE